MSLTTVDASWIRASGTASALQQEKRHKRQPLWLRACSPLRATACAPLTSQQTSQYGDCSRDKRLSAAVSSGGQVGAIQDSNGRGYSLLLEIEDSTNSEHAHCPFRPPPLATTTAVALQVSLPARWPSRSSDARLFQTLPGVAFSFATGIAPNRQLSSLSMTPFRNSLPSLLSALFAHNSIAVRMRERVSAVSVPVSRLGWSTRDSGSFPMNDPRATERTVLGVRGRQ